jgi:hypothetical protein
MSLSPATHHKPDLSDNHYVRWWMHELLPDERARAVTCHAPNSFVERLARDHGHPDKANPSKEDRDKLFWVMLPVLEAFASARHDRAGTPDNGLLQFHLEDARSGP